MTEHTEPSAPVLQKGECLYVHDETGRIRYTVDFPDPPGLKDAMEANGHTAVVAQANAATLTDGCVVGGLVMRRPELPVEMDGTVLVTCHSTQVAVDNVPVGFTDGQGRFDLAPHMPEDREYTLTLSGPWPFMPYQNTARLQRDPGAV